MNPTLIHLATTLLAWRPFHDPLPIDAGWYWLVIPLTACIAITYKALKAATVRTALRQSAVLTAQILGLIALSAAMLWAITTQL
jgi:hypothetical protein